MISFLTLRGMYPSTKEKSVHWKVTLQSLIKRSNSRGIPRLRLQVEVVGDIMALIQFDGKKFMCFGLQNSIVTITPKLKAKQENVELSHELAIHVTSLWHYWLVIPMPRMSYDKQIAMKFENLADWLIMDWLTDWLTGYCHQTNVTWTGLQAWFLHCLFLPNATDIMLALWST